MTIQSFKKVPGVLSFQRGQIVSDAPMQNIHADGSLSPLQVVRHGIRGTQNVAGGDKDVSNIQVTETAKTAPDAVGIQLEFSQRFLPLDQLLFSCAGQDHKAFRNSIEHFVDQASASEGLQVVARRLARNIFNFRWGWRNRLLGEEVLVKVHADNQLVAEVDALDVPLQHFDDFTEAEDALGGLIAESIAGVSSHQLNVVAEIKFGFSGAVEVFPSQNYVENKPRGFARPLYKLGRPDPVRGSSDGLIAYTDHRRMGQAALRDQKVSNALRTIDTWYPDYSTHQLPIAIEPHGANLEAMQFFRRDGAARKVSAFDLMLRLGQLDPSTPEGMYMIAILMRGGVFGESDKKEKAAKTEEQAA